MFENEGSLHLQTPGAGADVVVNGVAFGDLLAANARLRAVVAQQNETINSQVGPARMGMHVL